MPARAGHIRPSLPGANRFNSGPGNLKEQEAVEKRFKAHDKKAPYDG